MATSILSFRAVAGRRTRLKLVYVQSGDADAPPAKTFRLTLVVKPPG